MRDFTITAALRSCAAALLLLLIGACGPRTPAVTATERALCDVWRDALPTRSRQDTAQTQSEIGATYDAWEAVCGDGQSASH